MEANQDPSGAPVTTPVEKQQEKQEENVPYSTHKKVLNEKRNYMGKYEETKAELEKLKAEREAMDQQELEKQNEYKTLFEAEKAKREAIETDFGGLRKQIEDGNKMNAFDRAIGGKLKHDSYYGLVDLSSIIVEDGQINEESLKLTAAKFLEEHGDSLVHRAQVRTPNNNQAPSDGEQKTFAELVRECKTDKELDALQKKFNL